MNKTDIKKLAQASYTKDELDEKKVDMIAKNLKKSDIKIYIKNLKSIEMKKTVIITLPGEGGINEIKNYFTKLYPGRKIVFNTDESLISGIKVVDYDNVYELSLKNFLEKAIKNYYD
jgi:hypothetical protein